MARRPSRSRFEVSVSARVVEAFRGPWSPAMETFRDPGVARDYLTTLRPSYGPTVARASVAPGATGAAGLVGDWLCDDVGDAFGQNSILPKPRWGFSVESDRWSYALPLLDAWERCQDARWMLYGAAVGGVDPGLVVRAACDLVRSPLALMPIPAAVAAVAAAEAWADAPSARAADAAVVAAREARHRATEEDEGDEANALLHAAASAAAATSYFQIPRQSVRRVAATAVGWVASALGRTALHAGCSTIGPPDATAMVRARIPTIAVLRAAVAGAGGRG